MLNFSGRLPLDTRGVSNTPADPGSPTLTLGEAFAGSGTVAILVAGGALSDSLTLRVGDAGAVRATDQPFVLFVPAGHTVENTGSLAFSGGSPKVASDSFDVAGVLINRGTLSLLAGYRSNLPAEGAQDLVRFGGRLVNDGVLSIAGQPRTLLLPVGVAATVTVAGALSNAGRIGLLGGSNFPYLTNAPSAALLTVTAQGSLGNTGQITLGVGVGTAATLTDAGVLTNAGTITVAGGSGFSQDESLVGGDQGAVMTVTGALTNSGLINLEAGGQGVGEHPLAGFPAALVIAGRVTNAGSIDVGSPNQGGGSGGFVDVQTGGTLDNTATATGLTVGNAALISVAGVLTNAASITLQGGTVSHSVSGPEFASGGALQILSSGSLANTGLIAIEGGRITETFRGIPYTAPGADLSVAGVAVNTGTIAVADSILRSPPAPYGPSAGEITVLAGGTLTDDGLISIAAPPARGPASGGVLSIAAAGTLALGASGTVVLDGDARNAGTLLDAGTLTGTGVLRNTGVIETAASASVTIELATLLNDGRITVGTGDRLVIGHLLWDDWQADHALQGTVALGSGSTLVLGAEVATHQTLAFGAGPGVLMFEDASGMHGLIAGFAAADSIDLARVVANHASFAQGVLQLAEGKIGVASLRLAGSYASQGFTLHSDGGGGTLVTVAASA